MSGENTTLVINLSDGESSDTCSKSVLFQVKNGNLLPGQHVSFLIWGLSWSELDRYTVVDSAQINCTFVGRNTVYTQGDLCSSDVAFEGDSLYAQMEWPCDFIYNAIALSGIMGVTKDNRLQSLHSPGHIIHGGLISRKGYSCVAYNNNAFKGIVGAMRVYSYPPNNKEFSAPVIAGINPFFILRDGLFVKAFNIEVKDDSASDSDVIPSRWYSVNLYFVDADTGMPLQNVNVDLGGVRTGVTGVSGQVQFKDLPPGDYSLKATKIGYYDSLQDDIDNDTLRVG